MFAIVTTIGGNVAEGTACVFPFQYQATARPECIREGRANLWCSTTADYDVDQQWGECVFPARMSLLQLDVFAILHAMEFSIFDS